MILDLNEVKDFIQISRSSTVHNAVIDQLIVAAHKMIEREYNCTFLPANSVIPMDGKRYFIIDNDVSLALKIIVCDLFENRGSTKMPESVDYMLFHFKENGVG